MRRPAPARQPADGRTDDIELYVMPFAEGESLRQRLDREKQLPVDGAVQKRLSQESR